MNKAREACSAPVDREGRACTLYVLSHDAMFAARFGCVGSDDYGFYCRVRRGEVRFDELIDGYARQRWNMENAA